MMKKGIYEILARSPVFKGMKPLDIEEILKRIPYRMRKFKKGNIIAFSGYQCEKLLVLLEGTVKGEMVDLTGKVIEVETISAPRPLAPAFIFGEKNVFPVDVVADQDILVLSIPKKSLVQLFQINKTVMNNYLDIISNKAHFLSERLFFMSFKTIKEKFSQYIFTLLRPGENEVVLPKSQQELSEFFGVSRPSLARVIRELAREHIIKHNRREIIIEDLNRLKEILK
jgi:CRP-like cAMP-binding protein